MGEHGAVTRLEAARWTAGLHAVQQRIRPQFARSKQRQRVLYVSTLYCDLLNLPAS